MSVQVLSKLMQARMALHKTEIKKSGWNSFSNYKYMELADFLLPTLRLFDEFKLCGLVSFTAEIASLTITDLEDGSSVVITSPMGSASLKACHEVQNIGAVETYQRRYLWSTAMEVLEHDAIDSSPPVEKETLVPALEASIEQARQKKNGAMGDAWAEADRNLAVETKRSLSKFAIRVAPLSPVEAYELIEEQGLEPEEKTYLWGFLESKLRSAMKTHAQTKQLIAMKMKDLA